MKSIRTKKLWAVRSIQILSGSIHSSFVWFEIRHRLIHFSSQNFQTWARLHIPLSGPPIRPSVLHFSEKQGKSQRGSLPLCSVVESPILLGDSMFELSESEFVTMCSKAQKMLPKQSSAHQSKARRGQIKHPSKEVIMNIRVKTYNLIHKVWLHVRGLCITNIRFVTSDYHLHPSIIFKHVICVGGNPRLPRKCTQRNKNSHVFFWMWSWSRQPVALTSRHINSLKDTSHGADFLPL